MLRTGIYKLSQIQKSLLDVFGKEKNISLKLYDQLNQLKDPSLQEHYSETILNRFNSNSNAIKRTYRNRFNSFDDLVIELIQQQHYSILRVHDMAISDGRASCYFLEKLLSNFPEVEYHASDLAICYNMYHPTSNPDSYVIADEKLNIIEITKPPFVWNYARKEGRLYFLNNWLKNRYKQKYETDIKSKKLKQVDTLFIVDNYFKQLINKNKKFKMFNYNFFDTSNYSYEVIRVMNILHYGYFNDKQLTVILSNIHASLTVGGIFIEGSNENAGSEVDGAIFKKNKTGFELLKSANKSSRIIERVINFKNSSI